jgi:uncharacterized membrane protein
MTDTDTTEKKKTLVISDAEGAVLQSKLRYTQIIFFITYGSLLLLFTALNAMTGDGSIKLWFVQCVPLLIFVPGLIKNRYKTYSWICFVILPYFTWSVVNVMSPLIRWHDIVVVVLSVIIFIVAMMISRWLQYWQYYNNQKNSNPI